MDIVVFGAGSLGSLLGGMLARDHTVTLVGRAPHVDAIRQNGLHITGLLERRVHPTAVTTLDDGQADLAVVTVKAYDTPAAASALSRCDLDAVLSLQNGMGNEDRLARTVKCPVFAGTATYGAVLREPGHVACTGVGTVTLGPFESAPLEHARAIAAAFRESAIETTVATDMRTRLWEKLAVNTGINPVTALARVPNGAVLDPPAWQVAAGATRETAAVARATGIDLPDDHALARLEAIADQTAANTSSMRRDLETNRRTEIDAINGYVVDQSDHAVPINTVLTALIRTWEHGADHR